MVLGVLDTSLRKRYLEDNLTFEKALSLAQQFESNEGQSRILSNVMHSVGINESHLVEKKNLNRPKNPSKFDKTSEKSLWI